MAAAIFVVVVVEVIELEVNLRKEREINGGGRNQIGVLFLLPTNLYYWPTFSFMYKKFQQKPFQQSKA